MAHLVEETLIPLFIFFTGLFVHIIDMFKGRLSFCDLVLNHSHVILVLFQIISLMNMGQNLK